MVNSQFPNTFTHGLVIAKIARLYSIKPRDNSGDCPGIGETIKPCLEHIHSFNRRVAKDLVHGLIVTYKSLEVKCESGLKRMKI